MSVNKVPMRQCVVTRERFPKNELFRVVRDKDGKIFIDETGKANGKGAYLKKDSKVISLAKERNILGKIFDTQIDNDIYDELLKLI